MQMRSIVVDFQVIKKNILFLLTSQIPKKRKQRMRKTIWTGAAFDFVSGDTAMLPKRFGCAFG